MTEMRLLLMTFFLAGCCFSLPIEINISRLKNTFIRFPTQPQVSCNLCKAAVSIVHTAFEFGLGKTKLIKAANYVCNKFKIETHRVCTFAITEFADEVWNVFVIGFIKPDEICGVVLGDSCAHTALLYPSWNITIPPITKYTPTSSDIGIKKGSGSTMKVLQITDTHLDNDYMEGSVAKCKEPLCCRVNDGKAGRGEESAGKYGYPGYCDSNILLVRSLFSHVAENHDDIDYILWTGDVPAHNVWNQSRSSQMKAITQASKLFQKFFPDKRVFPTLGNHESVPVNSFPPPSLANTEHINGGDEWLYNAIADDWEQWLPKDVMRTIKKGGYYTALVKKGLRIVSLNTNFGHPDNWWLAIKSRDPADQLQWLISVLLQAEKVGEKVHIVGHIPPSEQLKWWGYNFYRIVDRFRHTITAQFYGHTHHDEFRLFYDMKTYEKSINVAYVGPSVTTYHHLNPGYRVYEIDGESANSSLSVVDHHTYFLDLMKAKKSGKALWEHEYSATKAYGLKNLSPASWNDLVDRMVNEDDLFQIYYRAFTKQHVLGTCEKECKMKYLCSMKEAMTGFHDFCNFDSKRKQMYGVWRSETYNKC